MKKGSKCLSTPTGVEHIFIHDGEVLLDDLLSISTILLAQSISPNKRDKYHIHREGDHTSSIDNAWYIGVCPDAGYNPYRNLKIDSPDPTAYDSVFEGYHWEDAVYLNGYEYLPNSWNINVRVPIWTKYVKTCGHIKLAPAGMVWLTYGWKIIHDCLSDYGATLKDEDIDDLYRKIMAEVYISSDAIYHHQSKTTGADSPFPSSLMITLMENAIDITKDEEEIIESIKDTVSLVSEWLRTHITSMVEHSLACDCFDRVCAQATHTGSSYVVCDKYISPSTLEHLLYMKPQFREIDLIVMVKQNGSYSVTSFPSSTEYGELNLLSNKHKAPVYIRGRTGMSLDSIIGTTGCIGITSSGFKGTTKDRKSAIALAKYWIANAVIVS